MHEIVEVMNNKEFLIYLVAWAGGNYVEFLMIKKILQKIIKWKKGKANPLGF
jgi:hypothetical protein